MSDPVSLSPDNRWSVSPGSLADVDVSLGRKHQGQPDARVVEHLRRSLSQHLKQETRGAAPVMSRWLRRGDSQIRAMY